MSKGYNNYWRESCIDYFSSPCEQHSIFKRQDYMIDEDTEYISNIEWKKMFKTGLQIKQNMIKEKISNIPNFNEDIYNIANELYTALKDYWPLPKLRKENLFVESPLNTIHQQNMYDFLYDQQDIYDYYDEIFESGRCIQVEVRRQDLPLADTLRDFYDVLNNEFIDESDMNMLASIRWYENNFNVDMGEKKMMIDDELQSSIFSTTFTEKIMEGLQMRNNGILSLLNSIMLTITYFCKITYSYMMKYSNNEPLFVDCYIKRVIVINIV
jgi:hypothetical protein